ncbi:MAG: MMPL family transporter, partial [Desulfobacteraceae bacterium]|nr:MMPL family transporter [Desulfobacteraceae bacterium]
MEGVLNVSPLMDYVPETKDEAEQIKTDALRNPVLVNNIISQDGNAVALNLYVEHDYKDPEFAINFTDSIEKILSEMEPEFEQIFQLGNSYTRKSITTSILEDQTTMVPLSVFVLLLTLLILMRSSAGAILPILTAGSSVLWSVGFMGYIGIPINILTVIVPSLIIVIGSTEDIHLLSEYSEGLNKNKGVKANALDYMISKTGTAVMLTALTTFLGFLSITLNDIEILMQFGIIASFGLFINPLITCLIAPVYLRFFGPKFKHSDKQKKSINEKMLMFLADHIIHLIETKKNLLLGIFIVITLFIGVFALNVKVDNDLLGYFKPDSKIRVRSQILNEEIAG